MRRKNNSYRKPKAPEEDISTRLDGFDTIQVVPEIGSLSPKRTVPVSSFVKYRVYRGKRRTMREYRYREDRDDSSSRLLLLVRKAGEDLFHIRIFDLDAQDGDDFLSEGYYHRDDEIEELIDDLCDGYSIESLLGSSAEYYVDGNTLNIIFDKYRMVRATEKQVEILEYVGERTLLE